MLKLDDVELWVNSRQIARSLELPLWLYLWKDIFHVSLGNVDVYVFIPQFLNPEDRTDRLSRNVGKKLPLLAA